ncbi:MAG: PAS domain S-box protein [Clostridiaceae bacterium]|nr:PAS domain S-box protein [Clostridiaceae bacterium]
MKKRIYRSMLLLIILSILSTAFLITGFIYGEFYARMKQEVRNEAHFVSVGFNLNGEKIFSELADQNFSSRITWIASDGTVLFDSSADPGSMENHLDRPEISDALNNGSGEAVHLSRTFGTQTFYHAIRLQDGTVVRVSARVNSVFKSVLNFIPYITVISVLVIILTMIIANLLTKKIIVPLNNLNLEDPLSNDVYDELSPLLSRMAKQNEQIELQFQKLREKQEEFNAITENVDEGIIILNSKGQILSINRKAAFIFGTELKDNINKHILQLNRSIPLQNAVEAAMKGETYEDTFVKGDNTFNILASPVKGQKPAEGIILFILDITERQTAEKLRREFSANVSHELKTPLTSISGYAELMMNGLVKHEDISVFSERIYNETRHLIRLVDDIIQISKLDEKNINFEFEKVDLFEVVKETAEKLTLQALQKGIDFSVKGQKAVISGVRQILQEIVFNLCDNAIKYNYEKGIVEVIVRKSDENVILTVKDNGPGIPKEHQSRIFERFYRVDKSHSRDTGGTGLGLSIVKHGVEFHKGKINLSSEPGKGTTVEVVFKDIQTTDKLDT